MAHEPELARLLDHHGVGADLLGLRRAQVAADLAQQVRDVVEQAAAREHLADLDRQDARELRQPARSEGRGLLLDPCPEDLRVPTGRVARTARRDGGYRAAHRQTLRSRYHASRKPTTRQIAPGPPNDGRGRGHEATATGQIRPPGLGDVPRHHDLRHRWPTRRPATRILDRAVRRRRRLPRHRRGLSRCRPTPKWAGAQRGDRRPVAGRPAARGAVHRHQGRRPGRRLVPGAGARTATPRSTATPSRAPSTAACSASARTTSTSTRRTGPIPACRSRRRSKALTRAGRGRQGARDRLQQRDRVRAHQEPVDVATATALPRYETIQNNFSLLNRRFEDELAEVCRRERSACCPTARSAAACCRASTSTARCPRGARFTLLRRAQPAHAGDDQALRQREHARRRRARFAAIAARGRHGAGDARDRLER